MIGALGQSASAVVVLADITLGADTSNGALWTPLAGIPQGYRDLKVYTRIAKPSSQSGNENLYFRLNGDATGQYGQDAGFIGSDWNKVYAPIGRISNSLGFWFNEITFYDYANASSIKTVRGIATGNNGTIGVSGAGVSTWGTSTAQGAITSIGFILPEGGNAFAATSRVILHGLR